MRQRSIFTFALTLGLFVSLGSASSVWAAEARTLTEADLPTLGGTDFDGGGGINGFNDASEAMNVTAELSRRGYSDADIRKIWGGNFLRVLREVEEVAAVSH